MYGSIKYVFMFVYIYMYVYMSLRVLFILYFLYKHPSTQLGYIKIYIIPDVSMGLYIERMAYLPSPKHTSTIHIQYIVAICATS